MRKKLVKSGVTVNAIAGTHVVTLGMDLSPAARKGCLGFAIQREDHTEHERYWMSGMKTFEATDPGLGPGGQAPSNKHPFQAFQWADYSAKPGHDYTYSVIPLYGAPAKLKNGTRVNVRIKTEKELDGTHSVFFNRGAIASQEYARRFLNQAPDKLKGAERDAALKWLSRGLLEAFEAFVARAKGKSYGLYGAVYEFQWTDALQAIRAAAATGADVRILYDGIPGATGPRKANEAAIAAEKITGLCVPRTTGKLMHNKFLVLTRNGKPVAVWTGSTNLTENGIFGHLNCGHAIEDAGVAQAYLAYWNELKSNPQESDTEKAWMAANNPAPPQPWNSNPTLAFSPRKGLDVLKWYAQIAGATHRTLFMTFAFGMHAFFQDVYRQKDGVLRFALMEKEGNGSGLAQGKKDIRAIRAAPNVVVAVGRNIVLNSFDRWLKELPQATASANVRYVHTKFMLVDPLGPDPVVVTGSANFSEASTDTNNENMVVIRGDRRVADIYLGEFMRSYSHYAFREAVAIAQEQAKAKGNEQPDVWKPQYLVAGPGWQTDYFTKGHQRYLRREYFAG